jgi:hypothetical protein
MCQQPGCRSAVKGSHSPTGWAVVLQSPNITLARVPTRLEAEALAEDYIQEQGYQEGLKVFLVGRLTVGTFSADYPPEWDMLSESMKEMSSSHYKIMMKLPD